MQRVRTAIAGIALVAFAAACGTERGALPTDVYSLTKVTASSVTCASYTQIVALAEVVFAPSASEVTGKLSATKKQLDKGNLSNARSHGMDIIDFILKKNSQQQLAGTQAQVTQLVNDILCWVGIAGSVPAAGDAFVVNPGSTKKDTIINSLQTAGVILPPGSVSEETIITIAPIAFTSTGPGSGPLITKLDQYPGYFHISKISATNAPFLQPVVVAVCPSPSVSLLVRQTLRLGHQAALGFELPPPVNADFLSCPVTAPALMAPSSAQSEGYSLVGKRASVELALDATGGVGGTTGTFSEFGTVDGTLAATGGVGGTTGTFIRMGESRTALMFNGRPHVVAACTETAIGAAVPAECRPTVSITTKLGTKLQNVPVSFAVTQGGGSVAPQTLAVCGAFTGTASVTTNNFGIAVACWKMGASVGVNTVTATPSTGGDVPATAVFSPATLIFNMNAVIVDNTAPVISDPVVTGTKGSGDWYTTDVSVSWQVADPETSFTKSGCSESLTSDNAGVTYTCSATNAVGLTSSRSITLKRDATVPTGVVSVTGDEGSNDWFTSDVAVDWTLTANGPSGLGSSVDCDDLVVSTDGEFSFTCAPRSGAGLTGASVTASGKRDASVPTVTGAADGTKGIDNWFISDVDISWTRTASGPSGLGASEGCVNEVISANGTFSRSCKVVSGAGVPSETVVTSGKRDASVPTVNFGLTGTEGNDGWYVSDVTILWTTTPHGPSGLGTPVGCVNGVINMDGTFSRSCKAVSGAGVPSATLVTLVKRDASIPTVSVAVNGTVGSNSWFVSDVAIDWTLTANGPSGLGAADGCADEVINSDGTHSRSCNVLSGAGVSSGTVAAPLIKRDWTKPVVSFVGNAGTYGVDGVVAITCSASDATSGVASPTCAGVQGAAYTFNIGLNSHSATTTDLAGNVGSGSTSFTVVLTSSNLCTLARRFSSTTGVANSLCNKLDNIAKATGNAKAGMVGSFINEVSAQTGKALNSADAAVLVRLVKLL